MVKHINIIIPPQFDIIVLKKKNDLIINLYNKNYNFSFFIDYKKNYFFLNKFNNIIKINNKNVFNNQILINSTLNKFLKLIDIYEFIKIKFKGKGFKIGFYKNKNIMNFFFGASHINTFLIKNTNIKKINKYKFIIKSVNINELNSLSKKIINIRKINHYTLRGLRKSRQILIKRKGRKGTFM
jgi:ribosomal protein L6P/L9E